MKITLEKLQRIIEEALEGYSSPKKNTESRVLLMASHALTNQLVRMKQLFDNAKNNARFWQGKKTAFEQTVTTILQTPLTQITSHVHQLYTKQATKDFSKDLKQIEVNLLELTKEIKKSLNYFLGGKVSSNPTQPGRINSLRSKAEDIFNQKLSNKTEEQIYMELGIVEFEQKLGEWIQQSFQLLKTTRQFFQFSNSTNVSGHSFLDKNIMDEKAVNALEKLDDAVIQYYSYIEGLFRMFLSIQDDMTETLSSSYEKIFGKPEPKYPPTKHFSSSNRDDIAQRKHWDTMDLVGRKMAHGYKKHKGRDPHGQLSPEDPAWRNPREFSFNHEVFTGFLTGKIKIQQKQRKNKKGKDVIVDVANKYTDSYPYEHKKSKLIKKMLEIIKNADGKIDILLRKKGVHGAVDDGPIHISFWDKTKQDYKFPEFQQIWTNMSQVKLVFQQKFDETLMFIENYEYEDINAIVRNIQKYGIDWDQNPNKEPIVKKFENLNQFLQSFKDFIGEVVRFVHEQKIQFKELINKLLTGESFENTPDNSTRTLAGQTVKSRDDVVAKRQKTWQKMRAAGVERGFMPSWAYNE